MQHSIVFLDRETLGAELRTPNFPHSYREYAVTRGPEVVERLKDATIAILNKVPMRKETLAQLPKLKLIAVAATGTDVIDKDYCRTAGITIVNIRNYAFNTVPEHVFAMTIFIFLLLRTPIEIDLIFQFQIASILLCVIWIYLRQPPSAVVAAHSSLTRGRPSQSLHM